MLRSVDVFSCIGAHAVGFERAGIETVQFCELMPFRRYLLAQRYPGKSIHADIWDFQPSIKGGILIGGPPCKATSVAAAPVGNRTGRSLWPRMLQSGLDMEAEWIVVEQPPGNSAWETSCGEGMAKVGYHVARLELSAGELGAPYLRRRVYLVACTSIKRLERCGGFLETAINETRNAAYSRGDWDPAKLAAIPVAFGNGDRFRWRQEIAALGDSNPPHMAEVVGRCISYAA